MKNNTVLAVIIVILLLAGLSLLSGKKNIPKTGTNQNPLVSPTVTQSPVVQQEISLDILSPANGQVVNSNIVVVKGKTVPKAEVNVNDVQIVADPQGNFSQSVNLDEGENIIIVVVNDESGKAVEKEITITYQP